MPGKDKVPAYKVHPSSTTGYDSDDSDAEMGYDPMGDAPMVHDPMDYTTSSDVGASSSSDVGPSSLSDNSLERLIAATRAHVPIETTTPAANRTVGRESARAQLLPAKRIAYWIVNRSIKCGASISKEVITAATKFLERWPESFEPGHSSKGNATCWICGFGIEDGNSSEIEHVLGMRPSTYRFTALCTPETLEFGGLTPEGWKKLNSVPIDTLKNNTSPKNYLDELLCNVKWNCIYDFFYNYAPAHKCCNQAKGNINEMHLSFLTRPIQIPHKTLPRFIPDEINIQKLLETIRDKIKEGTQWNCSELNKYLDSFNDPNWIQERVQIIMRDYLEPHREPNQCMEDSSMGLLSEITIALMARDIENIEKYNQSIIEYTKSINGTNPSLSTLALPGLPFYENFRSPNEPTFQLLARNMDISTDELQKRLESGDTDAINKLIEMRKKRKAFEDKKTKLKEKAKKSAAKKKALGILMSAIGKKESKKKKDKSKKKGGKRRYTKKIHFRSNLRKKNRQTKKKSIKKNKKTRKH